MRCYGNLSTIWLLTATVPGAVPRNCANIVGELALRLSLIALSLSSARHNDVLLQDLVQGQW